MNNYGFNAIVKMKDGKVLKFFNLTEIHHNYDDNKKQTAFESSIHSTGCTLYTHDISEMEITPAEKKHEAFESTKVPGVFNVGDKVKYKSHEGIVSAILPAQDRPDGSLYSRYLPRAVVHMLKSYYHPIFGHETNEMVIGLNALEHLD
jgi:hypothetical protein